MLVQPADSEIFSRKAPAYFRPWRELSALTLLLMELSAIVFTYRALTTIGRVTSSAYTYTIFGIILMAAYGLTRTLYTLRLKVSARRAATLLLLVMSWLIAMKYMIYREDTLTIEAIIRRNVEAFGDQSLFLPPEFGILLVVLLLVLRGVISAQRWMGAIVVVRSFRAGALLFLGLGLLQVIPWKMVPGIEFNLFLLAGLVAMSAARASELGGLRGGITNPFDRAWLVSVGAGAGLVVALVLIVAIMASTYLASPAARLATIAVDALLFLVLLLLSPLVFLLLVVFPQLAQGVFSDLVVRLERVLPLSAIREILNEVFQVILAFISGLIDLLLSLWQGIPDLHGMKPFLLVGVILVAVIFLLIILGRQWRADKRWARGSEERQSILGRNEISRMLRRMLRHGAERMVRGIRGLRYGGRLLAAARIRRIYAQLMRLCEELEFPRQEAQTPLEFLSTMERRFPDHTRELMHITRAYLRVRYGELPETHAQVSMVEAAWQAVRAQGEVMRKSQQTNRRAESRSLFKR